MVAATKIENELQKEFTGKTHNEFLHRAGLPVNYRKLTLAGKLSARMRTLKGWYDPSRPDILCTDPDAFVRAHFLWCEWYYKPAAVNSSVYYYDDPSCKYEIVRTTMSPSMGIESPAKTILHAPRRVGKTLTIIIEELPLIAITRPGSTLLLSEVNAERTQEEVDKIKTQIENNDRIHQDFGGYGKLWPKRNHPSQRWKNTRLDFPVSGSSLLAHSINSSQRGRGPIFGVIDDPEDDETTYSRDWRRKFFEKLFKVYVRMFHQGGKIVWIGTVIHGLSALSQALEGMSETEETQDHVIRDRRFQDWHKLRFKLIETDAEGKRYSIQPQRMSVAGFDHLMEVDPATAMAELQGLPVNPGSTAFHFDELGPHGFMHCQGEGTGEREEDYFLDLKTGETMEWKKFTESLRIFHAGDPADGVSADSDPGAIVTMGVSPAGVRFVLDAVVRVCFSEQLVEESMNLFLLWGGERMAWERNANQTYILRLAERHRESLEKKGKTLPVQEGICNLRKRKISRVLSMRPLFGSEMIRVCYTGEFTDRTGRTHVSVKHPHAGYLNVLKSQIREYTDEGIRGHDDAVDALEMVVRISHHVRPVEETLEQDPTVAQLQRWDDAGIPMKERLPISMWTEEMALERERELVAAVDESERELEFYEDM